MSTSHTNRSTLVVLPVCLFPPLLQINPSKLTHKLLALLHHHHHPSPPQPILPPQLPPPRPRSLPPRPHQSPDLERGHNPRKPRAKMGPTQKPKALAREQRNCGGRSGGGIDFLRSLRLKGGMMELGNLAERKRKHESIWSLVSGRIHFVFLFYFFLFAFRLETCYEYGIGEKAFRSLNPLPSLCPFAQCCS